jgi:hypothetical protein
MNKSHALILAAIVAASSAFAGATRTATLDVSQHGLRGLPDHGPEGPGKGSGSGRSESRSQDASCRRGVRSFEDDTGSADEGYDRCRLPFFR